MRKVFMIILLQKIYQLLIVNVMTEKIVSGYSPIRIRSRLYSLRVIFYLSLLWSLLSRDNTETITMKKILIFVLIFHLCFAVIVSAQTWCWVNTVTGISESSGIQSSCADRFGNIYGYGTGFATPIVFGGVTITGPNYIVKHRAATGTTAWIKGWPEGTYYIDCMTNDERGNLYLFYDSSGNCSLAKIDSSGNTVWIRSGKAFGSTGTLVPRNIAADNAGHIYLAGYVTSPAMIFGSDTLLNAAPDTNCFVVKYDTSGNEIWSNIVGSPHYLTAISIAANTSGDLFISALFHSPTIRVLDTTVTVPVAGDGIFVAKLDSDLHLKWITANSRTNTPWNTVFTFLEGDWDFLEADAAGNAYLAGSFTENDVLGTVPILFSANSSKFVAKYRGVDGNVLWAQTGGNTGSGNMFNFKTNSAGNSYACYKASAGSSNFGDSVFYFPALGGWIPDDVAIVSIDSSGRVLCGTILGGETGDDMCGLSIDEAGYVYVVGDFEGSAFFGDTTLTASGEKYFAAKYSCHCSCNSTTVIPTISISTSPGDTACPGTSLTFTAAGGAVTSNYQWIVNGAPSGSDDSIFVYSTAGGDSVSCIVSNGDPCGYQYRITSNVIVIENVIVESPLISIQANPGDTVCDGDTVTFTAITAWGGYSPSYLWQKNGVAAGTASSYSCVPFNGDSVKCIFTTSFPCIPVPAASSNTIGMVVQNCNVGTEVISDLQYYVYPNPATNTLEIQTAKDAYSSFAIRNSIGQTMAAGQLYSTQANVDIAMLSAGVYYLTLRGSGSKIVKFVKL